jgi:hypothetical protein
VGLPVSGRDGMLNRLSCASKRLIRLCRNAATRSTIARNGGAEQDITAPKSLPSPLPTAADMDATDSGDSVGGHPLVDLGVPIMSLNGSHAS